MPSFRAVLTVGGLRPGAEPRAVLPAASAAAAELTLVEAAEVGVAAGRPRLTVRFLADSPRHAAEVGEHIAAGVAELAAVPAWHLTQRVGGRWPVIARGEPRD